MTCEDSDLGSHAALLEMSSGSYIIRIHVRNEFCFGVYYLQDSFREDQSCDTQPDMLVEDFARKASMGK